MTEMCGVFGHSKQAYYKQLQQNAMTSVKEEVIVGLIKKKREIWEAGQWQKSAPVFAKGI